MDHPELDENKPNIIRKKSSFLRDGSYRIFHITKRAKENSDDDNDDKRNHNNNIDRTIGKKKKKFFKRKNRNELKKIFYLNKTTCELSSNEAKTPTSSHHEIDDLSRSIICHDSTTRKLSKTNVNDETVTLNNLAVRTDKCETINRKQVFLNIRPEIQASFHRRQKRFIVACGTVLIALSIIFTIIIYVIIMTVKHKTEMNQLQFSYTPR